MRLAGRRRARAAPFRWKHAGFGNALRGSEPVGPRAVAAAHTGKSWEDAMPNLPIDPESAEWMYVPVAEDLDRLSMVEDLEPSAGPSLSDLPWVAADDEVGRVAEELEQDEG